MNLTQKIDLIQEVSKWKLSPTAQRVCWSLSYKSNLDRSPLNNLGTCLTTDNSFSHITVILFILDTIDESDTSVC